MTNLTIRSDADQLNLYLSGQLEASLSPALAEYLKRLERVADWISRDGDIRLVAKKVINNWPGEISQATAYRMIGEAQEVYAPKGMQERSFYVMALLGKVAKTRKMAEAAQDLKVLATCDKNEAMIIEKFMGSNEAMPIDKIQPPAITFAFDPSLTGAPALPTNWQAQLEAITKKRKNGFVASAPDITDAQVLDETNSAGGAEAAAAASISPAPSSSEK